VTFEFPRARLRAAAYPQQGRINPESARKQTLPKITEWLASVEAEGKNSQDG
jgi:hypothetical protein